MIKNKGISPLAFFCICLVIFGLFSLWLNGYFNRDKTGYMIEGISITGLNDAVTRARIEGFIKLEENKYGVKYGEIKYEDGNYNIVVQGYKRHQDSGALLEEEQQIMNDFKEYVANNCMYGQVEHISVWYQYYVKNGKGQLLEGQKQRM